MRRVARLLEEGNPGERILLLSFTRVAAADLRDKVAQLEAPGIEKVRATTLHGYCFGLLQRESVLAITERTPRILLAHEVDLMLRDVGGHFGNIHERRHRLEAFVAAWARAVDDHPIVAGTNADREFETAIQSWLRVHKAMLIGEVVLASYRYLVNNPQASELGAFDHVIADEYQDLNVLEQRLLDTLAERGALCVAGDDDQSIYSVRNANPEGILSFLHRPDVEPIAIDICLRCPASVLTMANSLIRQAPGRAKEDLLPCDGIKPGTVGIVQWADVDAEVDGLVSNVAADIASKRRAPGDILVLTNWRQLGERIRSRLAELEIPARSYFTEEELATDDARAALALLRLVVDPGDRPALRVLVGLRDNTGRSDAYRRLLAVCQSEGQSPASVLSRLRDGESLGINVPALVQRFSYTLAKVEQLRGLDLQHLVDALFPEDQGSTAELRSIALLALVEATEAGHFSGRSWNR
jgi:superfamily I DNA/RNA helicase